MTPPAAISPIAEKYLRLHLCPDVGPIRFANLLREFGDIDTVLDAGEGALARVSRVGPKTADNIARFRDQDRAAAEIELARKHGVRILCLADDDYPPGLRTIADPPVCIYVRGTLEREDALALAIVGTRRCSHYGSEQGERFGALAANAGLTVVSGMARGIDTCAHRGAIAVGGRTIAVLGCGLCHLYPPESTQLAEGILEHGAIISALPMEIMPDAKNFPPRNRIVVGLALGVLVVEAPTRSGALISARLANEYNREVFAVPGRLDSPNSQGCHTLIKTGAGKLVTCLQDILEELGEAGAALMAQTDAADGSPRPSQTLFPPLDESEKRVYEVLGPEPMSVEDVCDASELPPQRVAAALTTLQLKGAVRRTAVGRAGSAGWHTFTRRSRG